MSAVVRLEMKGSKSRAAPASCVQTLGAERGEKVLERKATNPSVKTKVSSYKTMSAETSTERIESRVSERERDRPCAGTAFARANPSTQKKK